MTFEMGWRSQVDVRETAVARLLEVCGEYELLRRLGTDGRSLRPLKRRIDALLDVESTFDTYLCRPAGEGRPS